jgi:hypothetical protein
MLRQSVIDYAEFEKATRAEILAAKRLPTDDELDRVIDARGCSRNVARIHLGDYRTEQRRDAEGR